MKNLKRIGMTLLILAIVSTSLAACAGPAAPAASQSAAPSAAPASSSAAASQESAPPAEPVEMSFMSQGGKSNEVFINILNEYIEDFNANNQWNASFTSEYYENEQYKTKIATLMASNAQPDVFFTWEAAFLQPFVEGGKVYPLSDSMDDEWKNRFAEGFAPMLTFDGKMYGVPNIINYCVVYYNTRLFEENNVAVPKTFEELLAACDTFNAKGITPIAFGTKDAWVSGQYIQVLSNATAGLPLFSDIVAGNTTWTDPRYVESGKNAQKLVNANAFAPGYLGRSGDEAIESFMAEECAMFYHMASNLSRLSNVENSAVSKNLDFFLFPTPGGTQSPEVVVGSISQVYAMSSQAKNIDAAVAFLRGMSDESLQERIAYEWNNIPATKVVLDQSKLTPNFAKMIDTKNNLKGMTPWFDRVFSGGVGVEFNNASVAIMSGEDVEKELSALQQFTEDSAKR